MCSLLSVVFFYSWSFAACSCVCALPSVSTIHPRTVHVHHQRKLWVPPFLPQRAIVVHMKQYQYPQCPHAFVPQGLHQAMLPIIRYLDPRKSLWVSRTVATFPISICSWTTRSIASPSLKILRPDRDPAGIAPRTPSGISLDSSFYIADPESMLPGSQGLDYVHHPMHDAVPTTISELRPWASAITLLCNVDAARMTTSAEYVLFGSLLLAPTPTCHRISYFNVFSFIAFLDHLCPYYCQILIGAT